MAELHVTVINPDNVIFEGKARLIFAPGVRGTLGIMPGHTPMFAELVKGEILIQGEKEELVPLETGILKVRGDKVTILVGI